MLQPNCPEYCSYQEVWSYQACFKGATLASSQSEHWLQDIYFLLIRESSFDMTRGWGDEDIEQGLRKLLDTRKESSDKIVGLGGGASKICILQNQEEGEAPKNEPLVRGAAKISSFKFQYFHPPLVILNELSLKRSTARTLSTLLNCWSPQMYQLGIWDLTWTYWIR